jgi:conjugative relaxase-like TrwC/TraI family protein
VLRIQSGHSVQYYLDSVATGRESYYTGAVAEGEPPGRWYGAGAAALGLSGLVDAQDATAVYAHFVDPRDERFRDPQRWAEAETLGHTGRRYQSAEQLYAAALAKEPNADFERRDELRLDAAKRARHNVAFLDATFSVQKSMSILHLAFEAKEVAARKAGDTEAAAAWSEYRSAVEDAVWAGNNAMLDYLAAKAGYSRIGHHSESQGQWIDAHNWTIASFFQHDTRTHDPHLHIHNTILNRVQAADGEWRTLDSKVLQLWRPAAAAVAERTTEEYLTRAVAARMTMRPDGKSREVLGIARELVELASSRTRAINPKVAELAAAYEAVTGRAPKGKALDALNREAADKTRPAKSYTGESQEEFLRRIDRMFFTATGAGLEAVADNVVALADTPPEAQPWSPSAVTDTAIAAAGDKRGGWSEPEYIREFNNALPDYMGGLTGPQVIALFDKAASDGLTQVQALKEPKPGDDALTDSQRLDNGDSSYDQPGGQLYASADDIHTERLLQAAATRRGAPALSTATVEKFVTALAENGIKLGADQGAAVRGILGSGACVESLVGPAGTGKSFVTGVLAQAWTDPTLWEGQARRVVGLATTEKATGVLEGEGLTARNTARWLAIQDRLTTGHPVGDDQAWQLGAGDLVMVDESSMVDRKALAAIHQHVTTAGAKLLLTGDHRQCAAIGAGGGMELIVDAGAAYELTEARRFTNEWERDASLRLRAGDESVLTEYHKHGRLIDAGTLEAAEDSAATGWLADILAGKHSLLSVNSNEQAARLSAKLRAEFIRLGLVDEAGGVPVGVQGNYAGVNDLVQARRIARHLVGYEGNRAGPVNRQQYRVLSTRNDGGLVVAPVLGRDPDGSEEHGEALTLPGSYVAEHIELGYAATEYSIQGVTVGTSHNLATPQTSRSAFYMAMTRGRDTNTAHMATQTITDPDPAPGAVHDAIHRSPAAILALAFERDDPDRSALAIQADSLAEARSVQTAIDRLAGFTADVTTRRTVRWLDQLVDHGHLTPTQRERIAAEDGAPTLARVLRRAELAGHDPAQVLQHAVTQRDLTGARQLSNVLYDRITTNRQLSLDPVGDTYTDRTPTADDPNEQRFITAQTHAADTRRTELGAQAIEAPPAWAVDAFGPPPTDPHERRSWEHKAGIVAAHRELSGHTDPTTPLGAPPKPGQPEHYASYRAAHRALGRPDTDTEEMQLSEGQLRLRIRAWEREKAWAPPNVTHELAGTRQAATRHHNTATLRVAEARAATDPDTRIRLQQEAAEAAALANLLDTQIEQLTEIDDAYSYHLVDTAVTRANAHRAQAALEARHATNPPPTDTTSTQDWLAAEAEARRADDAHRDITDDHDLTHVADHNADDLPTVDDATERGPVAETVVSDIRELAAAETPRPIDDTVHVPTAERTADDLTLARRALAETRQRQALEARHHAEQARSQQIARWHADDLATEQHIHERLSDHAPPTLEPVGPHD